MLQPVRGKLVEALRIGEVLEAVRSEVDGLEPYVDEEVARHLRDQDLPPVRDRADPRRPDHVNPYVPFRAALGLACVQAHAHGHTHLLGPLLGRERALRLDGGCRRLGCARKGNHERVALGIDLDPTGPVESGSQEMTMPVLDLGVLRPEPSEELRRTFDVCEEQRDGAVR
jgi:hypothetical protein